MQLFYTPDISNDEYKLEEQESRHCIKVLRLQKGNIIHLTDGNGTLYESVITDPNPKCCKLIITKRIENFEGRDYKIHIGIAPTKNIERFEWFLEKVTEMGIDEVTPVLCEHSERKQVNSDRLERIIISAMKQSIKAYKPRLNPLTTFEEFIFGMKSGGFIAHCQDSLKISFKSAYELNKNAAILIGPEGDFSLNEIELAQKNNFRAISLGQSRLRTETAGVLACHTIHLANSI